MKTPPKPTARWTDDHLNRWDDSNYLSKFLWSRYDRGADKEGFALAINAGWGKGKSFLLRRWHDDLKTDEFPVVHFDAWKNDFTPEPLIGFIAALTDALAPYAKKIPKGTAAIKTLGTSIQALAKPALSVVGNVAVRYVVRTGLDEIREQLDDEAENQREAKGTKLNPDEIEKGLKQVFKSALVEHKTKAKAIDTCKQQLEYLVTELEKIDVKLPLFIFIDELDRCRPSFAIELLEGIKHLFGVRGVYFVIAVNMNELAASVKAVYGHEFNSRHYLRRFFDLEYTLEDPNKEQFAEHLFKQLALPIEEFVWPEDALTNPKTPSSLFAHYSEYFGLSLRDMEQAGKLVEAACIQLESEIHIAFLFFLAIFYQKSPPLYASLKRISPFDDTRWQELVRVDRRRGFDSAFYVHRQSHFGASSTSTVSIKNVVAEYYSLAKMTSVQIRQGNYNALQFPESLYYALYIQANKLGNSEVFLPIEKYFDVISNAGKFRIVLPHNNEQT